MADVTLSPAKVNYRFTQGDTLAPARVRINVGGTVSNGVVTGGTYPDFSGYTGTMKIIPMLSATATFTLTYPAGGLTLDSTGGIAFALSAAQTATMALGDYRYSIRIISPGGVKYTHLEGIISCQLDETNA